MRESGILKRIVSLFMSLLMIMSTVGDVWAAKAPTGETAGGGFTN